MTITHGTITANDLTYEHINCIVSIAHKVIVPNPDGPTHQQVHDFELDMLDYADKLKVHEKLVEMSKQHGSGSFVDDDAPTEPAPLPPLHIELPAETTGPLSAFTQTEDLFYLTVGGTQIVVERYDYIQVKATPFDMHKEELADFVDEAVQRELKVQEERKQSNEGITKLERHAPVQRTTELGKPAGTILWVEHEEAWDGYNKAYRGTGQDAERIAERGGFSYSELVVFLGHEPKTWKANA